MVYLGKANTAESFERYRRVLGEWLATGRAPSCSRGRKEDTLTVDDLVDEFLAWSRRYYLDPDGKPSTGLAPVEAAAKSLKSAYGPTAAAEFGPIAFKAVRHAMIEQGLCRNVINQRTNCIKRIFRWAVGEELLPPAVLQALTAVEPLRVGRSAAQETQPVRPVPDEHVEAVLPFLPPTVAAMVRLQRVTGMRSGEICVLRTCDIDTRKAVWVYRPRSHKTAYRGHDRTVRIGPKGQAVLRPFLRSDAPQAYVFSPQRALMERRQGRLRETQGNADEAQATPIEIIRPGPSDRYKPRSYNRALHYAMKRAEAAGTLSAAQFWHPHQLRHRHATDVRQLRGLEAARVLLGHRTLSQTLEYAEADARVASSLAMELG
jgi:integrase